MSTGRATPHLCSFGWQTSMAFLLILYSLLFRRCICLFLNCLLFSSNEYRYITSIFFLHRSGSLLTAVWMCLLSWTGSAVLQCIYGTCCLPLPPFLTPWLNMRLPFRWAWDLCFFSYAAKIIIKWPFLGVQIESNDMVSILWPHCSIIWLMKNVYIHSFPLLPLVKLAISASLFRAILLQNVKLPKYWPIRGCGLTTMNSHSRGFCLILLLFCWILSHNNF